MRTIRQESFTTQSQVADNLLLRKNALDCKCRHHTAVKLSCGLAVAVGLHKRFSNAFFEIGKWHDCRSYAIPSHSNLIDIQIILWLVGQACLFTLLIKFTNCPPQIWHHLPIHEHKGHWAEKIVPAGINSPHPLLPVFLFCVVHKRNFSFCVDKW